MNLWMFPVFSALGLAAGFLNVMAGGGSLITMPVMIFMGIPPATANGTNRVALLIQNITAVGGFRQKGYFDLKLSAKLAVCTLPGSILGAIAAVKIDPAWFNRILAVIMVGVLVTTLRKKSQKPAGDPDAVTQKQLLFSYLGMIFVGFYGGFIQAGVGFIIMAVLHSALKLNLVRVNMHKVFIVGVYMIPSLLVFAVLDRVLWLPGLALALGTAMGAILATRLQVKKGEGPIRVVFSLAIVAMAVKLALF